MSDARQSDEARLLALTRDPTTPLEEVAFEVARTFRPHIDLDGARDALDGLARGLDGAHAHTPAEAAQMLSAHLGRRHGFHGDQARYHAPESSFLDDVIARRSGLPITLSVLYVAVARRAAIPAVGIPFPGHFIVRVGGPDGVFLDPFDAGTTLDPAALERLARRALGRVPDNLAPLLMSASPGALGARMLRNLRGAYSRRGDHGRALLAAHRVVALSGALHDRRERGLIALSAGAFGLASEDLQACLEAGDANSGSFDVRRAAELARRRAKSPTFSN